MYTRHDPLEQETKYHGEEDKKYAGGTEVDNVQYGASSGSDPFEMGYHREDREREDAEPTPFEQHVLETEKKMQSEQESAQIESLQDIMMKQQEMMQQEEANRLGKTEHKRVEKLEDVRE